VVNGRGCLACRRFAELLAGRSEWLLLDNDCWSQAARDPDLRRRYAERELRAALGRALAARAGTLGAGSLGIEPERVATMTMALTSGLAHQAVVDPRAVPADLLGETIVLISRGLLAPPT
jgi:hypothetical protein